MMRADSDRVPVQWRMHIPVAPKKVFRALDSDEGRAAFWAESTVESNGYITFQFISGFQCNCRILERQAPTVWSIEYIGGPVRIELSDDGAGGTDLLLTHDVVTDEWIESHAGWLNVLFPLKAWLAFGVDLRNHDPQRTWDQGYADQ